MNIFITFLTLVGFLSTVHGAQKVVKYKYASGSNQTYSSVYWQNEACLEASSLDFFATDGFYKASGSARQMYKTIEGYSSIYGDCDDNGATFTSLSFYADSPTLIFNRLKNATVATTIEGYYSKSLCTIETYTYEDGYEYLYYECGEEYESSVVNITFDVFSAVTNDGVYTSVNTGVNRGPGYITKYKSSSKCKTATTTWDIVVGDAALDIDLTNGFTYGEICKANYGSSDRYSFY